MEETTDKKFSLIIGGPFYRLQHRLGMLGEDLLPKTSTAFLFAAIAWGPAALLAALAGNFFNDAAGTRDFITDYTVHARMILGVAMLTLMEREAEERITLVIGQFSAAGLVDEHQRPHFNRLLDRADKRTSSNLLEWTMVVAAFCLSLVSIIAYMSLMQVSWLGHYGNDGMRLSAAGYWILIVSQPLLIFLYLRWVWRFVVWAVLLRDISQMDLRLVATHPDQSGGLGFMAMYPSTFNYLIFALSCIAATASLHEMHYAGVTLDMLWPFFWGWVGLMALIFIGPLFVFYPMLSRLQDEAMLKFGKLAAEHNRAFEHKWLEPGRHGSESLGVSDFASSANLGRSFDLVKSMRLVPVSKETFKPLLVASGLPWLAVAATGMPIQDVLKLALKAVV